MRLMSVAPLGSRAVTENVWVAVVAMAGMAAASVGGCWGPAIVFQVLARSQPVPVLAVSVIQV